MEEHTNIVWAAAHDISDVQKAQLEEMGTLQYLKDIAPELHQQMCQIQKDTDLKALARRLQQYFSGNYVLVQPAGNPAFHTVLGILVSEWRVSAMVNCTRNQYRVKFAYSKRVSKDLPQDDGSIRKESIFVHEGWQDV